MPEFLCDKCGKRIFHDNPDTQKIEESVHKKFCRETMGETQSYMHRETSDTQSFDAERAQDMEGKPILKK